MVSASSKLISLVLFIMLGIMSISALPLEHDKSQRIRVNICCLDSKGKPLVKAKVRLTSEGRIVFEGVTNISGWVSAIVPCGKYWLTVDWLNSTVFSREVGLVKRTTLKLNCSVYHLRIVVNSFYIFPVTQAKIIVKRNKEIAYSYEGELRVPYGLYQLLGELILRLPKGGYVISVEMIGSESREVMLTHDKTIIFTKVASMSSLITLTFALMATISCILFLIKGKVKQY